MIKKIIYLCIFISSLALQNCYALEIMLPNIYKPGMELSGWLMSEKLDGIRAYWDGQRLLSKNGNPFNPPASFTNNFPEFAVEGELWGGRGTFEKTVGIVKKKDDHLGWHKLKFAIFDVPMARGGFEERLHTARMWFDRHPAEFAFVIDHKPVNSEKYLQHELKMINEGGGEGIILRRSGSPYISGRSRDVLKVKSYSDMEAVVVDHLVWKGRKGGRLRSLLVEFPHNKMRFKIGMGLTDAVRNNPPPIGTVITFKYYGFYNSGIPRFPIYLHETHN